jgi:hypothetical protein
MEMESSKEELGNGNGIIKEELRVAARALLNFFFGKQLRSH